MSSILGAGRSGSIPSTGHASGMARGNRTKIEATQRFFVRSSNLERRKEGFNGTNR